jgi:glycosyltransferase involved in cell wall biosynthesis
LSRIAAFLDRGGHSPAEVIVVDDGSRDGTAKVVEQFAGGDPRFKLLRNPGNKGKGYAVRQGMLKAVGAWRLMTDADLSTPIEELDTLEGRADRDQAAVAIGSRALNRRLVGKHQ